jgi:glycerophosphoryl diester phosphodiesterase
MAALDWLTARPIAHRGLHDVAHGIVENTPSAFQAAIDGRYGIECDLQITADGEAMIHHDFALGRLTQGEGLLANKAAAELKNVDFNASGDHMITLGELCELVAGRTPLVLELKSKFDGDERLVTRVANVLRSYDWPVAVMSFDPEIVAKLRHASPELTRGIVAERWYSEAEWDWLTWAQRQGLAHLLHFMRSHPQFVAYSVHDLPTAATSIARNLFRCPLLTWTVRTEEERRNAADHASQMIFEGFRA